MNYTLFALFMLFALLGCNTEMADLGRITPRPPMVIQLGAVTKLPGFSNSSTDTCTDIVVDSFENIICVGTTSSSMARASDGSNDAFVAKFDRSGKLLWIVQLQSSNAKTDNGSSVGIDSSNNIYIGGVTNGLIGTGAILNKQYVPPAYVWLDRTAAAADSDGYVAKISPSGQIQWIKQFGSVSNDGCNNIAVSPSGNSYCGSSTDGELGTDAVTGMDEYLGGTAFNPLVAKLDKNGNIKWMRQFGVISQPAQWGLEDKCTSIAIDDAENVYCGGYTLGNIADTNGSGQDVLVWMLDKNGFTQRILQVGVTADGNAEVGDVNADEACDDIIVDKQRNIYCSVTTTSAFGETGNGYDMVLMKWNSNGTIGWVTQLGNTSSPSYYDNTGNQFIQGINVDNNGNILATGYTSSPALAPLTGVTDVLMASFAPTGTLNWVKQYGSPTGNENCVNVTSDSAGNVYCAGVTTGSYGEAISGGADAFILRVDPLGNL